MDGVYGPKYRSSGWMMRQLGMPRLKNPREHDTLSVYGPKLVLRQSNQVIHKLNFAKFVFICWWRKDRKDMRINKERWMKSRRNVKEIFVNFLRIHS